MDEKELSVFCIDYIRQHQCKFEELEAIIGLRRYNKMPDLDFCSENIYLLSIHLGLLDRLTWSQRTRVKEEMAIQLEAMENRAYNAKKSTVPKDPVVYIKQSLKGLNWNEAKRFISFLMPASFLFEEDYIPSDDKAEEDFQRFINVSEFGTYIDVEFIRNTSIFVDEYGRKVVKRLDEVLAHGRDFSHASDINSTHAKGIHDALSTRLDKRNEHIKVYRGTSTPHALIRQGDFVTPDKDYARDYIRGNDGVVITDTLPIADLVVSKIPFDYNSVELIYYPVQFEASVKHNGLEKYKKSPEIDFKKLYSEVTGDI